jgi:tetraacyldisaccharide 4'-kinase
MMDAHRFRLLPARRWLWPLSLLYGTAIWLRNFLFDRGLIPAYKASRPVIAIGNLSTGGTGKTPFAEYLIRVLLDQGVHPAYISRGYGRKSRGYLRVVPGKMGADHVGDEALQVASRFEEIPVVVCEDRQYGIRKLLDEGDPQVFVLDDAFQHRKVARDLNVVVVDAQRLPTDDLLLPAGNLREPVRNLKRANLLVINKVRDDAEIAFIAEKMAFLGLPMAFCRPQAQRILHFSGEPFLLPARPRVVLFSAIGNNESFRRTAEEIGLEVVAAYAFRDHYVFASGDLERIIGRHFQHSSSSPNFAPPFLLTTEKDFFRMKDLPWLGEFSGYSLAYLPIRLAWISGESIVMSLLREWIPPA